jgi:BirA family biotin operon repressor/biotin-[acetyl-CoA-carboxylase] ligase
MTNRVWQELGEIEWLNAVEYRASTGSTNDLALQEELVDGEGWGWLYVADEQTAGRGRRGNAWWAGEGALTFSLVVDAERFGLSPESWSLLPLATGLAVRDVVAAELPDAGVSVKWPNDVYLNARKVAGILVEQRNDCASRLVVGVGVNVNTAMAGAPDEIADAAVSLLGASGREHDLVELLGGILLRMEMHLRRAAEDAQELVARLNTHSYLTGRRVRLDLDSGSVWGDCRGIANGGGLTLATADGVKTYVGGTVGAVG